MFRLLFTFVMHSYRTGLCCYRFTHPVTFGGMLEMSIAYLPVNKNWQLYIDRSQAKYDELQSHLSSMLTRLAKEAVEMPEDRFVLDYHCSYISKAHQHSSSSAVL